MEVEGLRRRRLRSQTEDMSVVESVVERPWLWRRHRHWRVLWSSGAGRAGVGGRMVLVLSLPLTGLSWTARSDCLRRPIAAEGSAVQTPCVLLPLTKTPLLHSQLAEVRCVPRRKSGESQSLRAFEEIPFPENRGLSCELHPGVYPGR